MIEQSKEGYYLALRQTQGTIRTERPDWQPWVLFFLHRLDRQKNRLDAKVERERIVLAQLPELSVRILDFAREHGRVSAGDMVKLLGASHNTLKAQFSQLVERGYLVRHGGGRTTWYMVTLPTQAGRLLRQPTPEPSWKQTALSLRAALAQIEGCDCDRSIHRTQTTSP